MHRHQRLRFISVTDERPDPEWPPGQQAPAEPEPSPARDFLAPGVAAPSGPGFGGSDVFERQFPAPPAADTTEPLPQRIEPLPSRAAAGPRPQRTVDPILQRTADALAGRPATPVPPRVPDSLPQRGAFESLPQRGMTEPGPGPGAPLPQRGAPEPLPQRGGSEPLPQRGGSEPLPQRGAPEPLPQRGAPEPLPQRGGSEPLPQRGAPEPLPQRGGSEPLPARNGALPRRTGRNQRAGRHRSPHRLSVASDAPALILAVPGSATGPYVRAVEEIAATAETSCPGVEIRVGFIDGDTYRLEDALSFDGPPPGEHPLNGVIVPLLAGPHPTIDATLARLAEAASGRVMLGAHLGGHPLIAEALHARLAEAGIARESRSRGLTMATATYGVVVLADRGEDAVKDAGVAAVLLASRLSMPAAPATNDDPASIDQALARLRDSGAERPVISPCLIGPETPAGDLEAVRTAIGAPMAAPLGGHPAIGQLVAIRYGAALARLSMAG
jgi:sirohydrochlorin ferrochelatase